MPRLQDILFLLFAVAVAAMLAFGMQVAVVALVGAFTIGAIYLLAGMLPERAESFWRRLFTTVFLSLVLASLVLILPGTFGAAGEKISAPVVTIAVLLPIAAACFEIARTPRLIERALRLLSRLPGGR